MEPIGYFHRFLGVRLQRLQASDVQPYSGYNVKTKRGGSQSGTQDHLLVTFSPILCSPVCLYIHPPLLCSLDLQVKSALLRFTSAQLARAAQAGDDVAQGADWGRVQQLTDPTQALKALLPGTDVGVHER